MKKALVAHQHAVSPSSSGFIVSLYQTLGLLSRVFIRNYPQEVCWGVFAKNKRLER